MESFIAQIIMFGGNFAPRGWAFCNGQLLSINQNATLFSLIGTTYGGDGKTTFALPDLRGRTPIHFGHGPGLTDRKIGKQLGSENNIMTIPQMPVHTHNAYTTGTVCLKVKTDKSNTPNKQQLESKNNIHTNNAITNTILTNGKENISTTVENSGGHQPINNIQPSLGVNFIISLEGIYPSRN